MPEVRLIGGEGPAIVRRVLLKLFFLWTTLVLRALGARRVRRKIGEVTLLAYEIGPPDGDPWVLLHGLGATAVAWSSVIRVLRKKVRLLVPELSSLGGTESPAGGLNVAEGVTAVEALIAAWAPEKKVTLAGISLGGWMSVRIALERPEIVERLVLVDAGGYRDQDWNRIQALTDVSSLDDVDRLYRALFFRTPFVIQRSRRGFLKAYTSPAVRHVLETTTEEEAYGPEDLARIHVPTLLVWGEHDGLFRAEVGRAMEGDIRQARLVVIPNTGHAVHWERPRAMAAVIDRFRREGLDSFDPNPGPAA